MKVVSMESNNRLCVGKRARECPDIHSNGWLRNKRVCLVGSFTTYRRASVVDALRREGAEVYIHPTTHTYSVTVVGSGSSAQPPYIEEEELVQDEVWRKRFDITLPWYLQFKPQCVEDVVSRRREIDVVCSWLKSWSAKGKAALLMYGPCGCGKKTIIETALHSLHFTTLLDLCADNDVTTSSYNMQSISVTCNNLQSLHSNLFIVEPQGKSALLLFNAESLFNAADIVALERVLTQKIVPVIFMISEDSLQSGSVFWEHMEKYCRTIHIDPLASKDIISVLQRVSTRVSEVVSDVKVQEIAENCEGDLRHALNALESMIRFDQRETIMHKETIPTTATEAILPLTTPIPTNIKLKLVEMMSNDIMSSIETAIHGSIESNCRRGAPKKNTKEEKDRAMLQTLVHMEDICSTLSYCDLFYPASEYRSDMAILSASKNMRSITSIPRFSGRKSVKTSTTMAKKALHTPTAIHAIPSMSLDSASNCSMNLLSSFSTLLKQGPVNNWIIQPSVVDRFSMSKLINSSR